MFEKIAEQFERDVNVRYQEKLAKLLQYMEKDAAPIINSATLANVAGGVRETAGGFMSKLRSLFKDKNVPITSSRASVGLQNNKDMANYITSRIGSPYKVSRNSKLTKGNNDINSKIITEYKGDIPQSLYVKDYSGIKGRISDTPLSKINPIMTGTYDRDENYNAFTNLMYGTRQRGKLPDTFLVSPVDYNW